MSKKGERPGAHDKRVVNAADWQITIFLNELMSSDIKKLPDWLRKAKTSLGVVCDVIIDEYKSKYGNQIYGEYFLNEAIKATEDCIKNYEW